MATTIRPEISKSNPYYISKHRYYELKHYCLQYPEWRKDYISVQNRGVRNVKNPRVGKTTKQNSLVETDAMLLEELGKKIDMVELVAATTDPELGNYILQAVTQGRSYESVLALYQIPCSKDTFYNRYRKFFWLLNSVRG